MPVVFVYQASDFSTGIPDESGGSAAGSPPFTLTLNPGAVPIAVEITDSDGMFDEVDNSQTLTSSVTINGVTYSPGDSINSAFHLSDSGSGVTVTSFHVGPGVSGYDQGAVQGVTSSELLTPGSTYTFDSEVSTWTSPIAYAGYVACFTKGTMIETSKGAQLVENLAPGDKVLTRDDGAQALHWLGHRTVPASGDFAPVVFMPGAIGNDAEIAVSPQHRMLIRGWRCEMLFGAAEVLVPALHLVNGDTVYRRPGGRVTYYHMLFDKHQIVYSNGVPSESFHPSDNSLAAFSHDTRAEVLALFPELRTMQHSYGPTARRVLKKYETNVMLQG